MTSTGWGRVIGGLLAAWLLAPVAARADDRADAFARARTLVEEGELEDARAVYVSLVGRDPRDDEARVALARVDAWLGRYDVSLVALDAVLARHPDDDEVRALRIDVLLWSGRTSEASRALEEGLARSPQSPALWVRRARLEQRRGQSTAAIDALDRAEALAPADEEIRSERDRRWSGEVRAIGRAEILSDGLPTLPGGELVVTQHVERWRLWGRTEHRASLSDLQGGSAYNAAYGFGVARSFEGPIVVGLELALGEPVVAMPRYALGGFVEGPLVGPLSGRLAYNYRDYPNGVGVHIVAPALEWAIGDELAVTARGWFGVVRNPDAAVAVGVDRIQGVYAGGVGAAYQPTPAVAIRVAYAYGAQLELVPEVFRVATVRSHTIDAAVDLLLSRNVGLRPLYRFEARATDTIDYLVNAPELATYVRW